MASLSAEVKRKISRDGVRIGLYVELVNTNGTFYLSTLPEITSNIAYRHMPVDLDKITAFSQRLNPLTRKTEVGGFDVVVGDGFVRQFWGVESFHLLGTKVTINIGTSDIAYDSWSEIFVGYIDELLPDGQGKTVTLRCKSYVNAARDLKVYGYWLNMHPLDVIYDILITKGGLNSGMVDTASLDPSDSDYDEFSHYVLSRANYYVTTDPPYVQRQGGLNAPSKAESALELCNQVAQLLNGGIVADESNGKIKFKLYDPTATAVAHWDADVFGADLRHVASGQDLYNKITVVWKDRTIRVGAGNSTLNEDPEELEYSAEDTTAQQDVSIDGGPSNRVSEYKTPTSLWIQGYMGVANNYSGAADTAWDYNNISPSITGTRDNDSGASQASDAKVSAARPMYIKPFDRDSANGDDWLADDEVIKVTSFALNTGGATDTVEIKDPDTTKDTAATRITSATYYFDWDLSSATRAHEGTATTDADPGFYDITIPYNLANDLLERFKYGLDIIELKTPIALGMDTDPIEVELGDLVTIEHAELLAYGIDGVTSSTKWEVIQKDLELTASPPHIKWRLAST
jgi:hypothetical protein